MVSVQFVSRAGSCSYVCCITENGACLSLTERASRAIIIVPQITPRCRRLQTKGGPALDQSKAASEAGRSVTREGRLTIIFDGFALHQALISCDRTRCSIRCNSLSIAAGRGSAATPDNMARKQSAIVVTIVLSSVDCLWFLLVGATIQVLPFQDL